MRKAEFRLGVGPDREGACHSDTAGQAAVHDLVQPERQDQRQAGPLRPVATAHHVNPQHGSSGLPLYERPLALPAALLGIPRRHLSRLLHGGGDDGTSCTYEMARVAGYGLCSMPHSIYVCIVSMCVCPARYGTTLPSADPLLLLSNSAYVRAGRKRLEADARLAAEDHSVV